MTTQHQDKERRKYHLYSITRTAIRKQEVYDALNSRLDLFAQRAARRRKNGVALLTCISVCFPDPVSSPSGLASNCMWRDAAFLSSHSLLQPALVCQPVSRYQLALNAYPVLSGCSRYARLGHARHDGGIEVWRFLSVSAMRIGKAVVGFCQFLIPKMSWPFFFHDCLL